MTGVGTGVGASVVCGFVMNCTIACHGTTLRAESWRVVRIELTRAHPVRRLQWCASAAALSATLSAIASGAESWSLVPYRRASVFSPYSTQPRCLHTRTCTARALRLQIPGHGRIAPDLKNVKLLHVAEARNLELHFASESSAQCHSRTA